MKQLAWSRIWTAVGLEESHEDIAPKIDLHRWPGWYTSLRNFMLKLLTKSSGPNSVFQVPYWFSEVYMFHFTRIESLDIDRKTWTLGSLSTAASRHKTRHFRVQTYELVPCMGSKHPRTSQNFTPSICVDHLIPWGTKSHSSHPAAAALSSYI